MTMQRPPSGFPYIWGKFCFLFYKCTWIVNVVSTAVLLICAGGAEAARAVRVEGRLSLEADPLAGGAEAAGAVRVVGGLGLETGPLAGGAEAAGTVRVICHLGLEADPLAWGAEAAGATRLAGGCHTWRVWPHSHRQALLQPTELTSSDEKNNQNSHAITTVCAFFFINVFLTFLSLYSGHTHSFSIHPHCYINMARRTVPSRFGGGLRFKL